MPEIARLDAAAFRFINHSIANPVFDCVFWTATLLGHGAVQILAILWFWVASRPGSAASKLAGPCFWALALASVVNWAIKDVCERPRPLAALSDVRLLVDPLYASSFPSGHAATTFAIATVVSVLQPRWRWQVWTLAVLIGLSRVYVGVHFPLDVMGSLLLGFAAGMAVLSVGEGLRLRRASGKEC